MHGWVPVYVICPYLSSAEPTQSFSIFWDPVISGPNKNIYTPTGKLWDVAKVATYKQQTHEFPMLLRSSDNLSEVFNAGRTLSKDTLVLLSYANRSTAYLNPPIFCWTEKSKGRGSLQTWPNPCLHFAIRQNWHTCHCSAHVNLWEIAAPSLLDDAALHP